MIVAPESIATAAAFLLLSQVAPIVVGPVTDAKPFNGGPLAGLGYGDVVDPAGKHFKGLLPSLPNASPIAVIDRAAVSAFIRGYEDGGKKPLKDFLATDVKFSTCSQRDKPCSVTGRSVRFGEACTANTPYRMADGTVRIEWLYGSALYYISKIKLRNGKISTVQTAPAWAPIVIGS